MTLHAIGKGLPDNLSGLDIDNNHLLSTVSVGALSRADGWTEAAIQIDETLAAFEEIMNEAA